MLARPTFAKRPIGFQQVFSTLFLPGYITAVNPFLAQLPTRRPASGHLRRVLSKRAMYETTSAVRISAKRWNSRLFAARSTPSAWTDAHQAGEDLGEVTLIGKAAGHSYI
jgi:hypothetical protein